jgi:hypothetical protein
MNAVEGYQRSYRELHSGRNLTRCSEIGLRDFVRVRPAGVLDGQSDVETAIGGLLYLEV